MLQRSAERRMKRRNFFSTLLAGALGLVGMSRVQREERVTDRLRRRLEEHQKLASIDHVWVKSPTNANIPIADIQGSFCELIPLPEMPKPLSLMEMPPEVLEFYERWRKERGL